MALNLNPTDSEEEDAEDWARWEAERVEERLAHENTERETEWAAVVMRSPHGGCVLHNYCNYYDQKFMSEGMC